MSPERLVTMLALAPTMPELRLSRMLRVAVLGASSLSSALSSALSLLSLALSLSSALNILDNLSSDMVGWRWMALSTGLGLPYLGLSVVVSGRIGL
ncbi:uncharacterized protein A4U43_C08F27520 [Asparagus officinalis]|nr:uncharacterized protein A4U43_C08F27520 [Asparagus officinalis]